LSKRIYVGNLPWSITYEKLKVLFSSFGEIEQALVIANRETGRSRGFGFVTFKDDKAADTAIKEMSNKEVEGRVLVVKEATPMGEKSEEKREIREEVTEEKPRKARKRKEKKEEKPDEGSFAEE
jgi:RNA recognition motif-containing protein